MKRMKQMIQIKQPEEQASFIPEIKFRKIVAMNTATRIIRPLKGGGYKRKEKFEKHLTADC